MRSATLSRCISTAAGIAVTTLAAHASAARRAPEMALEPIAINDNRVVAGTRDGDRVTIHLEARQGEWHPEGETDDSLIVRAFAEEGGPLQIPGPLIRVVEGTRIRAVIRNRLDQPIAVHGLYMRPASGDRADAPVIVPAGDARNIEFGAGAPGTYFYWAASDPTVAPSVRDAADSQLSGGLIVDPRGASTPDRVLLITSSNEFRTVGDERVSVVRFLINGKTWPHTERLAYDVGDTVRIRVLNVGLAVHPMHLHGFYFRVDSRGTEGADTTFPPRSSPHLVNTERLPSGRTFSLTWTPTRPGNWLFHCHDASHTARTTLLDGRPVPPPDHHAINHALDMMTGPIIGITVRPAQMTPTAPEAISRRALRLIARADSGGTDAEPAFGFALEERGTITPAGAPYLPGPTIILKRGEPVSVTIENRLPEPTAVHWHGIELESYYDGVAGFAGSADRLAPAIPTGGTFEARFTPPMAGVP
jgi:FtsP/CotA-like multicopper oxidase with cupredoxin domain